MPIVALPDGREVDFPDGVSEADMTSALQRDFPDHFKPVIPLSEDSAREYFSRQQLQGAPNLPFSPEAGTELTTAVASDPVGFIKSVPEIAFGAAAAPGKLAYNAAADVVSAIDPEHGKEYGGNLASMMAGAERTPAEKFIGSAAATNPGLATTANIAKSLPEIASMMAANPSGAMGRILAAGFSADAAYNFKKTLDAYNEEADKENPNPGVLAELRAQAITLPAFSVLAGHGAAIDRSPSAVAGRMLGKEVRGAKLETLSENTGGQVAREVGQSELANQAVVKIFNDNVKLGNTETAKALAEGEKGSNAIQEQGPSPGVLRQERSEVGLPEVGAGGIPGQAIAQEAKPLNPGGAVKDLPPELQAIEAANQAKQRQIAEDFKRSQQDKEQGTAAGTPTPKVGEQAPLSPEFPPPPPGRTMWPAVRGESGKVYIGIDHLEATAKATQAGDTWRSRGYVTPDGSFKSLTEIAREAMDAQLNREARVNEPPTPQPESAAAASSTEPSRPVEGTVTPEVTPAREFVGMGGAVPAEFEPTRKFITKNTIEQINKERKERGLDELPEHEVFPNKEAKRMGEQRLDDDPMAADKIMEELGQKSRPLTPDEQAVMVIDRAQTFNSYFDELRKFREGIESGNAELAAGAEKNAEYFMERLDRMDKLVGTGGAATKAGQAVQAYKMGIREDMSLEMMTLKAMKAIGRKLTIEEASEIQRLHKENADLKSQLDAALAKESAANAEADSGLAVAEAVTSARKQKGTAKARDVEAEQKAVLDHLKETFIENGELAGQETSIRKLMELLVLRENITERLPMETRVHEILRDVVDPTITREQAMDLMSGYGKSRRPSQEFSKKTVRDINAQILQVRKLLDYMQGQPPKATGLLRDAPSDTARQLTKMVNEAKKAFHLDLPTDPASQAKQLKSALDAVKTRLNNRLKDLKQEVATRQKIIKSKAAVPSDAETIRLRNEIAETQKLHDEIFGKTELTDAQKMARLEASTDRQISELERQLKTGEIFPSIRIPFSGDSPKLQAARARLDELKATRQFAREAAQPKLEPEQQFALNYLLRLRQRAAEYQERAARGDFAKKPKPQREHSPDVLQAMAEVDKAKAEYQRKLHQWERDQFTTGQKIWDGIQQTRGTLVNLKSSMDFSAPRQALLAILGNLTRVVTHPLQTKALLGNPFGRMFQAWASEARSRVIEQRRLNRPNSKSGADKAANIEYSALDSDRFTKYEENAHSYLDRLAMQPYRTGNAAKTVLGAPFKAGAKAVRMSNRAFITFLNETRAALFDELLRVNYKDRPPTKSELEVIGNLINVVTGRGKMNPKTSQVLSEFFWAPKLLTSRIQFLTGQPLWTNAVGKQSAGTARARKIVAKEYARIIASGFLLRMVSQLFDEKKEDDPRSSDYGKIVRGDTRIDPWGGLQQNIVLTARAASGQTKRTDGQIVENDLASVLANFTRNKMRPDIGAVWNAYDIAMKKVKPGRPDDPIEWTGDLVAPLPLQDVVTILKEHGFTEGMIIEMLGQFGAGVSYQGDKERQR